MGNPWDAERVVDETLARALVTTQFPALACERLEPFGQGWDNTAWLVDGAWLFRFPRRAVAVPFIEREARLLPRIASELPLPVPVPEHVGRSSDAFPWPFAGYRLLPGRTASDAELDDETRARAAVPLGRFVAALHALPTAALELPGDEWGRLDLAKQGEQLEQRLHIARRNGLVADPRPALALVDALPSDWTPRTGVLCHGDLHARNLLVDDGGAPAGVVDWGDVHLGEPAVDLAIGPAFLPESAWPAFRSAYGGVEETRFAAARLRAAATAAALLVYAHDVGETLLARDAGQSLERAAGAPLLGDLRAP